MFITGCHIFLVYFLACMIGSSLVSLGGGVLVVLSGGLPGAGVGILCSGLMGIGVGFILRSGLLGWFIGVLLSSLNGCCDHLCMVEGAFGFVYTIVLLVF